MRIPFATAITTAALALTSWLSQECVGVFNDRVIESVEIEPPFLAPLPKHEAGARRVFDRVATQRIDERTIAVYSHDFLILTIKLKPE